MGMTVSPIFLVDMSTGFSEETKPVLIAERKSQSDLQASYYRPRALLNRAPRKETHHHAGALVIPANLRHNNGLALPRRSFRNKG